MLHDRYGQWILGFSGSCGFTTNINDELLAIHKGLNLAWNKGYNQVVCESDSQPALDLIAQGTHHLHPHAPLVTSIRAFWLYPWEVSFQHSFREGNAVTDWLAKEGALFDQGLTLWRSCPKELSLILLADASGSVRMRL